MLQVVMSLGLAIGWMTWLTMALFVPMVIGGLSICHLLVLPTARLTRTSGAVTLRLLDADTTLRASAWLSFVPLGLLLWSVSAAALASIAVVTFAASFRLCVEVSATGTVVRHQLLFFFPWSSSEFLLPAEARLAVAGDYLEYTEIEMCLGGGEAVLSLAWADESESTRCEAFVRAFNASVTRLAADARRGTAPAHTRGLAAPTSKPPL